MKLQRVLAMGRKELLHIVRDPRSLTLALALPLIMLLLFSFALSLDVDQIPTVLFDQDESPESRSLLAAVSGSKYFEIAGHAASYDEIDRAVMSSRAMLAIVVPRDFARDVAAGRLKPVQILIDGTDSNTAAIARGYAESAITTWAAGQFRMRAPIEPRMRVWYNSSLESRNFIVPGLISVILMIIAALLTSLTVAREWEMGTLEQLLSTPLRPAEIIIGKLGAFFLLGVVDAIVSVAAAVLIFNVPFRGSLIFLGGATAVFLVGAFSWGLFLSSIANTQLEAFQMGMLSSFLPAFLLSGFIYAIENMPLPVQAISSIFPSRYYISILKASFLKGLGFEHMWPQLLALVVYSCVVAGLAMKRMRTKVA